MIDELAFLLVLVREQNFSKAAEQCGAYSQPSLRASKQLKEALGVMLVQRTARFIDCITEGEHVLEWVRGIAADARALRPALQALKQGLTGRPKIAVFPTTLATVSALTTPFRPPSKRRVYDPVAHLDRYPLDGGESQRRRRRH